MDLRKAEDRLDAAGQARAGSQSVKRRASKKSSSQDRHGKIFKDTNPRERTIRAVTPDSPSSVVSPFGLDGSFLPSPTPKSPRARLPRRQREHSASVSNTDEETTLESRRRKSTSKAKLKDDLGSDASPSSFITKTRQKIESITTSTHFGQRSTDNIGSIGFPSVMASPGIAEINEQRPRGNTASMRSFSQTSQGGLRSPLLMNTDSSKILHLMKTTCGRMHGILFFRPTNSEPWASGYCAINVAPGSLVCQVKGDIAATKTLIPDLRGCTVRTHYDADTQGTYLSVITAMSGVGFQLRPPVPETFDSWLAALLCWQPLRPKGLHNRMTKPPDINVIEKRPSAKTRSSQPAKPSSNAIIKIGKVLLWDGSLPPPSIRGNPNANNRLRSPKGDHPSWRRVGCTLHETGQFKLLAESDATVISQIPLSQLSRCGIQQLHSSVLDKEFCIAIFPHYSSQTGTTLQSWPMFFALDSRTAFEVWFVLLRAFTLPELYGPEQILMSPIHDGTGDAPAETPADNYEKLFRVERSLSIKITEARLAQASSVDSSGGPRPRQPHSTVPRQAPEDYYAEVLLERDLRARTATKSATTSAFWAEEFHFDYLPSVLSRMSVVVKIGNPAEREWTMIAHGAYDLAHSEGDMTRAGKIEISSHDTVHGRVDLQLDDLLQRGDVEKRWPMVDKNGHTVGDLLMKISLRETVVLMQNQYTALSELLHNFSNSLTPQIAQILAAELKQLSEILLDIFQVSGSVSEWINNLIEEEIDGIYKETPPARLRFSGRTHSSDSYDASEHRELLVRDLNRSANNEANLLFRGNSLATKALDAHMRRLGKDYLDESLGTVIRHIIERDPDCEVDPTRVRSPEQQERNWGVLISITSAVWKSITDSAARCPSGLRVLFKHIRSCAEDRYGGFIRTVKYTSVSGFLFLRLFCPAILNPELFGLLRDRPAERPRRTLTLVAKSLIVLANMTKFGAKEPWMEPMNKFLVAATPGFKSLIDEICSISSSHISASAFDPQTTTPIQIAARLPPTSREGFPSLPYLLDSAKLYANLVTLWLDHSPTNVLETGVEECVRSFHEICNTLQQKNRDCVNSAEQAGRPDGGLEPKWQELLVERQRNSILDDPFEDQFSKVVGKETFETISKMSNGRRQSQRFMQRPSSATQDLNGDETPPSSASMVWDQRKPPFTQSQTAESGEVSYSTNSSTLSLESADESKARPVPSSRDGPSKNRLLDLTRLPNRRKGKHGAANQTADDNGNNEI